MNQNLGRWALFGVAGGVTMFVEKARGGVREWTNLNRLAAFLKTIGIARFEVHDATAGLNNVTGR